MATLFFFMKRIFLSTLILFTLSISAIAEGRWALIVGNANYTSSGVASLQNTLNDARTMTSALSAMGFDIYTIENASRADIDAQMVKIKAEQADTALGLFFYAGHGVQHEGVNYILPTDIEPNSASFLQNQAISAQDIIESLAAVGSEKLVIILDACRNSPFGADQAFGVGLALSDAPPNTIISYATSPGAVALDGSGANSPFTAALAATLDGPRQDFRDVLRLVRAKVRRATDGEQTPWFIDNVTDEIWLDPNPAILLSEEDRQSISGTIDLASITWNTINTSADQNDFQLFVDLFPENQLVGVASRQIQLLTDSGYAALRPMDIRVSDPNQTVPDGLSTIITQCDILATPQHDPFALVEGVPHDLVNTRAALRVCIQALRDDPSNARVTGLLARVLILDERYDEGNFYLQLAADRGYTYAYGGLAEAYRIGRGVDPDPEKAASFMMQGALAGNGNLRVAMAEYYREGWGVPQSYAEARHWFEIASMNGQFNAFTALGDMYRRGHGLEVDYATALELYLIAAGNGETDAMNNVGMAYLRGEGVTQNPQQAIFWLTRATAAGNPYSAFHLGRMFRKGWGVENDPTQALAYFKLSAQRNFVNAYQKIGEMYEGNDGIEADLPQAYANYIIAYEGGLQRNTAGSRKVSEDVAEHMARLDETMSEVELTLARSTAQDWIDSYGVLDFNMVNR
ncbi:MAG: caspase family protein [Rhodobacteraceae bacterium]|nr:caspase family protein [Paracoccaceae bacterium]